MLLKMLQKLRFVSNPNSLSVPTTGGPIGTVMAVGIGTHQGRGRNLARDFRGACDGIAYRVRPGRASSDAEMI